MNLEELNQGAVDQRLRALKNLAASTIFPESGEHVNMHMHSFFSYNAYFWSPTRVAWEAKQAGLMAAGLIDFDVLDGMEEFYEAGEILGLRTNVGLETRVYYPEFATFELDSPGEPGVHYIDGIGFTALPHEGSREAQLLKRYRQGAQDRNIALVNRINAAVTTLQLDYAEEVIPLSPGGCPTERHIISAFANKAETTLEGKALLSFWADLLDTSEKAAIILIANRPALEDKARSRLAKKGGLAYVQPDESSFPPIDDFFAWVKACGAIPMESWLDGTSDGESQAEELIDCTYSKGARVLNIIPDRNWNLKDPKDKAIKVENLRRIIRLAEERDMPINIGTELNKLGLPFVDDLNGSVLSEFKPLLQQGALIMVGHSVLSRYAKYGYLSEAADTDLPDIKTRNTFFTKIGSLPSLTQETAKLYKNQGPEKTLEQLRKEIKS